MTGTLTSDRKRAFGPWLLLSALALTLFRIAATSFDMGSPEQNALLIYIFSDSVVPVMTLAPLAAAVPFASGFANDWRSGVAVPMLIRSGRDRFLRSKEVGCAVSGGLTLALSAAMYILFVNLWFSSDYSGYEDVIAAFSYWDFSGGFTAFALTGYYAVSVALQFLGGMFYASCALAFSAFVPNVSLTLCVPLVLYRLFEELADTLPAFVSPYQLQAGTSGLGAAGSLVWAAAVFLPGTMLALKVFRLRAGRRLEEES